MARFQISRYADVTAIDLTRNDDRRLFLEARERVALEDINSQFFEYVVREGDTYDLLAFQLSGREDLWWLIADLNVDHVDFPLGLAVGTKIIVPYPEIFQELLT